MNEPTARPRAIHSLEELPREIAPQRDLWPGIRASLAPRRRAWAVPASLAAGVLLATVGVLVGMQVREGASPAAGVPVAQAPVTQPGDADYIRAALLSDPTYETRRRELLEALPGKLDRLPPASRARVLDSLKAVQAAMRSLEAELGKDGSNALLQELFIGTCQEEMRVLTAVDAVAGPHQEI